MSDPVVLRTGSRNKQNAVNGANGAKRTNGATEIARPEFGGGLGALLGRWWRRLRGQDDSGSLRETLEELMEEGDLPVDPDERMLLENIGSLRDVTLAEVMVPRAHIVAAPDSASLVDVTALINAHPHSRLPVYHGTLDEVVGMLHIKDLIPWTQNPKGFHIGKILRPVLFVAPSTKLLDLLVQMRKSRMHMAFIVDEFGGIDGMATIEDLVEEIIGDIHDEHDLEPAPDIVERPDGALDVRAATLIKDFEARVGAFLTEEERAADTLTMGGLIFSLAERVPRRGELIYHPSGFQFEVLDADRRRVRTLRVRHLPPPEDKTEGPHGGDDD